MALFKILKGTSANFSATAPLKPAFHEGYCYYVTDTNLFYIDYLNGTAQERKALNAENAKALSGKSYEEILNSINSLLEGYYTKSEIDAYNFITTDEIDEICGQSIVNASEVTF